MHIERHFRSALVFFFCLTTAAAAVPAPAPGPTNMDLLVETLEAAVDEVLVDMPVPEGESPVLIVGQKKHDAGWLVEHILAARLLDRGFAVNLDTATAALGSARLSYLILDLGVSGRSGLLSRKIQRQAQASLTLQLSQGEDQVLLWRQEVTTVRGDRVSKSRMDLLQNDKHEFAQTDLEEQTWSKFVEPVMITTVLGGLIYLFFSNR